MTLQLHFRLSDFPRNITKAEWKELWRWKRVTEKRLEAEKQKALNDFIAFGTTISPKAREDFIYHSINPTLLVHDKQGF